MSRSSVPPSSRRSPPLSDEPPKPRAQSVAAPPSPTSTTNGKVLDKLPSPTSKTFPSMQAVLPPVRDLTPVPLSPVRAPSPVAQASIEPERVADEVCRPDLLTIPCPLYANQLACSSYPASATRCEPSRCCAPIPRLCHLDNLALYHAPPSPPPRRVIRAWYACARRATRP